MNFVDKSLVLHQDFQPLLSATFKGAFGPIRELGVPQNCMHSKAVPDGKCS